MDILTTILPLFLVVGLLYAALIFVRRNGIKLGTGKGKISPIKVISTQAIMPKKFVSIVKVEDSFLVLGVSENSITLLKELDEINEDNDENESVENPKFSEIFKQNLGLK
jgi:flagellar protein FliO/FliZ